MSRSCLMHSAPMASSSAREKTLPTGLWLCVCVRARARNVSYLGRKVGRRGKGGWRSLRRVEELREGGWLAAEVRTGASAQVGGFRRREGGGLTIIRVRGVMAFSSSCMSTVHSEAEMISLSPFGGGFRGTHLTMPPGIWMLYRYLNGKVSAWPETSADAPPFPPPFWVRSY